MRSITRPRTGKRRKDSLTLRMRPLGNEINSFTAAPFKPVRQRGDRDFRDADQFTGRMTARADFISNISHFCLTFISLPYTTRRS